MNTTRTLLFSLGLAVVGPAAGGCSPESARDDDVVPPRPEDEAPAPAVRPETGELLIEELYYSGAAPRGGTDHYFSDQFIELVNAASHPLDLSGVMVADVFGAAGEINPGMVPAGYRDLHPDQVVMSSVWRMPEGARLEPGEHLVIAHDGTNHRPFSTIDLSGARYETFVADASDRDEDHPTVDNLEAVVFNGGFDWLVTVFGPSIVVLAGDTPLGVAASADGDLPMAAVSSVLDGVECLMDGDAGIFKRLPDAVDAGFVWVEGTYVGQSIHRKRRDGGGYRDTGHSGMDFVVGPPAPTIARATDGVYGDPWIELGTGRTAFTPLTDSVELVAGIQGGWHVDVSLRFGGFGPDGVRLVYEVLSPQAEPLGFVTEATLAAASVLEDGDHWLRVGDRVVLDIDDPAEVVGEAVVVRVTAALDGQTWSDERTVLLVDDEA